MRRICLPLLAAAALAVVGLAPLVDAAPAAAATPRLSVTAVATGLDHPWDVGFLPNGRMLVTERPGRLSRIVDGRPVPMAQPGDVVVAGEAGMLGLAVDPQFSRTGYVFVCMASDRGGARDVRVVRFTLDGAGTHVLHRADVVTGLPFSSGRHSGCRPRFGPDGYLWVGTGDAATGTNPQDPGSLGGKVLRVTRSGASAPGNPGGHRWYTKGHRNVQGLAFRGSQAFSVEHGTDRDDEVNRLVAGANYGWDPVPGYDESTPMTDTAKFPGARRAIWRSGFPTIAPSGATFLTAPKWGDWQGRLAVAVLKAQRLRVFSVNAAGTAVTGFTDVLTGYGRLRSAVTGPGGDLYVATDATAGRILRVVPTATGAAGFPDVSCSAFYTRAVQYLVGAGITTGVGSTGRFQPGAPVDRGQLATFLWRSVGEPSGSAPPGFADVARGAYYYPAVAWLRAAGLTTGVGGSRRYEPDRAVTRAEMVTFLWRLRGAPDGYPPAGFTDLRAGAFYERSVRWARATGLTTGVGGTRRFAPGAAVTRGEAATFLYRLAGSPAVTVRGCG